MKHNETLFQLIITGNIVSINNYIQTLFQLIIT